MRHKGAFQTGEYRNLLLEYGYPEDEINRRVDAAFEELFHGPADRTLFHPDWPDMAGFEDTGNSDARTEGMSYAMMMCVQMDRQREFDMLWKFAKTFMWHAGGKFQGYFAWTTALDGTRNSDGPAPDGEEYFAMALFFASHRWGDREPPYDYSAQARAILHECIHKGEDGGEDLAMWDRTNYLVRFVPGKHETDASYHLPHFYELFALWADEADRPFWKKAAEESRKFLHLACHPVTGLCPEKGGFDGSPAEGRRGRYYSDAYRVPASLGLDSLWFNADPWQHGCAGRIQRFFCENEPEREYKIYEVDGTVIPEPALHPVAIIATNAQASLASSQAEGTLGQYARECVALFWDTPLRTGVRRYYDNCLYFFALLALSGRYRIWWPGENETDR